MGEAADQVGGDGEGAGQGLDPRVAEPQGWGPPTVHQGRSRDPLKGWTRKDAALTDMFMIQQSAVDVTGLALEFGQMDQAAQHPEVGRVVDHGLDPQRAAFLEVLLGAGMFVADVDAYIDAAGDDPGSEDAGRRRQDLSAEDQLDLLGPAEVEIVGHQGLEERPPVARGRRTPACATPRSAASTAPTSTPRPGRPDGERQRQPGQPAVEERPGSGPGRADHRSAATRPGRRRRRSRSPGQSSRSRPGWLAVSPTRGRSARP